MLKPLHYVLTDETDSCFTVAVPTKEAFPSKETIISKDALVGRKLTFVPAAESLRERKRWLQQFLPLQLCVIRGRVFAGASLSVMGKPERS